jgi:hypothetical protein
MKHTMSMIFFTALSLLVACSPVSSVRLPDLPVQPDALPQVFGVLQEDRVLDGEVVLAADLLVPPGRILTLRPGTTVYVRPNPSTKIDPEWLSAETELLVRGSLRVEGTAERPVTFLPLDSPDDMEYAWAGILLDRATGSEIRNARIYGAETAILCIGSSPLIRDNLIAGARYGLVIQDHSAPQVIGNLIQNGEAGVFCWRDATPELRNNRISGHQEEGLFIDRRSRPRLGGNRIEGNDLGLVAYDPELAARVGRLTDNREDFRLLGNGVGK